MISKMSRLIVPFLIVMAVVLAACSTSGSDDEASFAFAEDTAASSGTFVTAQVKSEMSADEADEMAVMLAWCHTGSTEIIALRNGYAGRSMLAQ